MSKDDFLREAFGRGYRNDPMPVLEALYDVSAGLAKDHPYLELMDLLREGRAPGEEYSDISSADHPYLVTEEILKAADTLLAGMDDTAEVKRARQLSGEYFEPWMRQHAQEEREELPGWRAYEKLDREMLDEAGQIAAGMKENGNKEGLGETEEFTAMTGAIEAFAASVTGAVYGSALGLKLEAKMDAMGNAIERFIEAEKRNVKNPNVTAGLIPLKMADPEKAAKYDKLLNEKSAFRNRIRLESLEGEKEKRPVIAREHREKQGPAIHAGKQL